MRLRALTCAALAVLVAAGCGSAQSDTSTGGDTLTVYSSLPLQGAGAERSRDVLDGEKLALYGAHGKVGPFTVSFSSLDDSTPKGGWDQDATVKAARRGAADVGSIAYLGDFDAGATALSLPTTNATGVLQVSPGTTYAGFTGGETSTPGEPDKYEPSGRRTFGRIAPSDAAQARTIAAVMSEDGCRRVAILRAPSAFDGSLADLVKTAAEHRGLRVVLAEQVRPDPDAHQHAAQKAAQAGADCATFAGGPSDDPAGLLQAVHAALPDAPIVLPMGLADAGVARTLGDAATVTTILGPPPPSPAFTDAFRQAFGRDPGPWAPYGHEAMRRVLAAIDAAGDKGNDRRAVIDAYLRMPPPAQRIALWRATGDGLRPGRTLPST